MIMIIAHLHMYSLHMYISMCTCLTTIGSTIYIASGLHKYRHLLIAMEYEQVSIAMHMVARRER